MSMLKKKGDEVEVMSEEEGFRGAWFGAVLGGNTTKSGRRKIRVRYLTLVADDNTCPLIETVKQSFIRPVPPLDKYQDIALEEGVVVDADHRDGWWKGIIVRVMEQGQYLVYFHTPPDVIQFHKSQLGAHIHWNGLMWVRPGIQPVDKSMYCSGTSVEVSYVLDKEEESVWVPSMLVTEAEEEDSKRMFIVKNLNCDADDAGENLTVEFSRIRPAPPVSSVQDYKLLEPVEAFHGSSWRQGEVRGTLPHRRYLVSLGASVGEAVCGHSDLRPLMEWEGGLWRNRSIKQQTVTEMTSSSITKSPARAGSSGVKPTTPKSATLSLKRTLNFGETVTEAEFESVMSAQVSRKKMAGTVVNDDSPLTVIHKIKPKAQEPVLSVIPSLVLTATPVAGGVTNGETPSVTIPQVKSTAATSLKPVAETGEIVSSEKTFEQVRNQSAMETETIQVEPIEKEAVSSVTPSLVITDSTQQKMNEESRKRKRDQEQHSNSNEIDGTCNGSTTEIDDTTSKKICNDGDLNDQPLSSLIEQSSPDQTPNMAKNSAAITHVDKARGEERVMSLPFAKKSPYWKTCETTEIFKTVPQRPHFSPLYEEAKEELREWSAVGMMVSFYGYLDQIKTLKLDDPPSKLNGLRVSLAELEKHGFDVESAQSRIKRMLSLQDERKMNMEENKCFEERIEKEGTETRKVEQELVELKREVLEVQRLQAVAEEKKEQGKKMIVEMKASVVTIAQKLEEVEVEFQKTTSAPW